MGLVYLFNEKFPGYSLGAERCTIVLEAAIGPQVLNTPKSRQVITEDDNWR